MTEDAFLERLFARLPAVPEDLAIPQGDDCAAVRTAPGRLLLIAVDQLVGGRHYHLTGPDAPTPERIGRKLVARNLSDIAAMGGVPRHCLVAAALSRERDEEWLNRFFSGILEIAGEFGLAMIGGDLAVTLADDVTSLTIVGEASEEAVCRRSGATAGDGLFATGLFGSSLGTGHHLSFVPRCREGAWLAEHGYARAAIDVSDGLLLDARRLCRASGVGLILDADAVPRRTAATELANALTDGEDYELLAAVPADRAEELAREWPFQDTPLTRIGEFVASDDADIVDMHGKSLSLAGHQGYDHFVDA